MKKDNVTPKQASIKIASLARGIDNSINIMQKQSERIRKNAEETRELLPKVVAAKPPVPSAKPQKAAVKPAKKVEVKVTAKRPNVAKAPTGKSVVAKLPASKPAAANRPTAKEACKEIIEAQGGSVKQADIFNLAVAKYGSYSRTAIAKALGDSRVFTKTADGLFGLSNTQPANEAEVEAFVDRIDNKASSAVANVQ